MASTKGDPRYRLVVFEEIDEPAEVRDLLCRATGMHPTDAMLWISKLPGAWPHPLPEDQTRTLLDGMFDLGVAAEAWIVEKYPDLNPPRTVHDAACVEEGFRVKGLRGEPTHWVPWNKIELICAGRVEAEDQYGSPSPPKWPSVVATGLRALTLRKPRPMSRTSRASRVSHDPVGEVVIVRTDPLIAFRVVENKMNYGYLGNRLGPTAASNFPIFLADLCARADRATITPSTRAFLNKDDPDAATFPTSQALLDHANLRLLWSWYQRDREKHLDRDRSDDAPTQGDA
jgi:hypothetical protein